MAVKDRFDIPIPNIASPVIPSEKIGSQSSYYGLGDPNGVIPAYIAATYIDTSTEETWTKLSDHGGKTGWARDDEDSDSDVTSTGTTTARSNADRWAEVKNVKDFGVVANGTTDDYTRLVAALAAVDVLRITGVVRIGTNLTISSSKVLIFEKGGKLKPSSGVKIIVNGEIQAGRFEIFDYTAGGSVCIGFSSTTTFIFPEWYGAKNDNSTNNDTAFARIYDPAFTAGVENHQPVILATGYYNFVTGFTIKTKSIIRAETSRATRMQIIPPSTPGTVRLITLAAGTVDNVVLEGIQFVVQGAFPAGVRTIAIGQANDTDHTSTMSIRDCVFNNFNQYAVDIARAIYFEMLSTEFADISNRTTLGGTGDTPARCVNFRVFGHGVTITGQTKLVNCDSFIKTISSASLTFSEGDFEQTGANGLLIDAITNKGHFMYLSGYNIRILNNYSEGIRTTSPDAVIHFQDCANYEVRGNYMHGHRAGGSTSVSQIFVSVGTGCKSGRIEGNYFGGIPVKYINSNGSSEVPLCFQNSYADNSGVLINSYASIKPYVTFGTIDFSTNSGFFFTRPVFNRHISTTAGVGYPVTLRRDRNGSAGAIGDGVGVKIEGTRGDSTEQPMGEYFWEWIAATASVETADLVFKLLGAGTQNEAFRIQGLGGITVRGGIHATRRLSAIDTTVLQNDSTIVLTATGKTASIVNSTTVPFGTRFTFALNIGGAGTGTVAFVNGSDRIQPGAAATYSLSADGKYVTLELVAANTWIVVGNN